jgi:NADH:ubiquinone oxidoreductase subunit K
MLTKNLTIWTLKIFVLCEVEFSFENAADILFELIEKGQIFGIPRWVDSLFLFYLLFLIGLLGMIFNYKNYLVTMFCIELMYLGITICFVIVSISTADPKGQIYAILLLVLAAAESAIGLGVLIVLYRFGSSIDFRDYQELKN